MSREKIATISQEITIYSDDYVDGHMRVDSFTSDGVSSTKIARALGATLKQSLEQLADSDLEHLLLYKAARDYLG